MRIRFSPRDPNATLARPGMSVETAVAVSTPDNASPTERGNRVGCSFDPLKDRVVRTITKIPERVGPRSPSGCPRHTGSGTAGTLAELRRGHGVHPTFASGGLWKSR